jgi:UDP-N-acetylmuramoyl-L-alanyl-D-glutamate--2,6-diaminopimelate ligase
MRHTFGQNPTGQYQSLITDNRRAKEIKRVSVCDLPLQSAIVETLDEDSVDMDSVDMDSADMDSADMDSAQPLTARAVIANQPYDESASGVPSRRSLAAILPSARFFGCSDIAWTAAAATPAECEEGQIVTYRIGEADPTAVIAEAMARGASGLLTEQMLPCPIPQCIVPCVDRALAEITAATHERPDRKLLTIGILGRSGKTSTCLLAAKVTQAAGIRTAYQCDLGSGDGVLQETPGRPLPSGTPLIEWIAEASDCCSRIALIEINETDARHGHYDAIEFDVLIVTGRREKATDFGPSGLQCLAERLTPNGIVVVPGEDQHTIRWLEQNGQHFVRYGADRDHDVCVNTIDRTGGMATLMLSAGDTSVMMETSLCSIAMTANIAAATTLGTLLGISLQEIAKSLESLRKIPGRGQRLVEFGHATVVLEHGGSIERIRDALRSAKMHGVGGRVWCVMTIDDQTSADDLAGYGRAIECHAHHSVITSKPEQSCSFLKQSHQVLDGVKECASMRLVADQNRAIEWVMQSAGPRDTIVVLTNSTSATPLDERSELEQLEHRITSLRNQLAADTSEPVAKPDGKISLKLFP